MNDLSRSDQPQQSISAPDPRVDDRAGVTLNINDYVWVRLTEKGRAMLREHDARWSRLFASSYGRLATAQKQEAENDGWSRWQLWSLIQDFGPAVYLGCDPPFETTIRLRAPQAVGYHGNQALSEASAAAQSAAQK